MTSYSKSECWINIIVNVALIVLSYFMLYKSPNLENLKSIIPLICACAGWMLRTYIEELAEMGLKKR